jgi:hypothetical protein
MATAVLAAVGCARPTVSDSPPLFAGEPGEIERRVPRDSGEAWDAVIRTLRRHGFTPVRTDHDRLGGDVAARKADRVVFVRVRRTGDDRAVLSVRTEPADPELSRRLHESFALGLGMGEAKDGLFGGHSTEARAAMTIDQAVKTARDVLRALRIEETGLERKGDEADVRGRTVDSIPVRILLASEGPKETEATFIVGDRKRDPYLALAERMKEEFERRS